MTPFTTEIEKENILTEESLDNESSSEIILDENFLNEIDYEKKAYFLGLLSAKGSIRGKSIKISVIKKDKYILNLLRSFINESENLPIRKKIISNEKIIYSLSIISEKISENIIKLLNIENESDMRDITFAFENYSQEIRNSFVRGFFDGNGNISKLNSKVDIPECNLFSYSIKFLEDMSKYFGGNIIPFKAGYKLVWHGVNCLDLLGNLYNNSKYCLLRNLKTYLSLSTLIRGIKTEELDQQLDFKWTKCRENAVPPFKARVSDSGWDLTLLEKIKEVGDVEFYATGIKVLPDFGWYFDMVPRSSLSKTDYMLANSVGVIDRSYIGEIIVPLRKMKNNPNKLELPGRYIQIIPRPIIHFEFNEVDNLEETHRSEGGFGSSGV